MNSQNRSSDVVLLDGGMGRELQDRGLARRGSIWSALALIEAPEVVTEVHEAFAGAGADVLTTNNYSVVPQMLAKEDRPPPMMRQTACSSVICGGHGG